jgi:hypothetical protein
MLNGKFKEVFFCVVCILKNKPFHHAFPYLLSFDLLRRDGVPDNTAALRPT